MTVGISPVEDELYREIILDHWRTPRHHGVLEPADVRVEGNNPLCGDELLLTARLRSGRVEAIAFTGQGCSISRASASMMCEGVAGQPIDVADGLRRRFVAMLLERGPSDEVGDLEALQGVATMPARVKCALLAWNALRQVLQGHDGTVTTETDELRLRVEP
ncbi:MAG TPA: SUF system NifU family Fe-S cluster assembly protein [Candidatus Dormibacteraeota bacterium]